MRTAIKFLLILIAFFLVGLMMYASVEKIRTMVAVSSNPEMFNRKSIEYHYRNNQLLAYIHIILGMFFLLAGAYQLIPFIRQRYWHAHRVVGRLFLAASLLVSITAIIMAFFFPFGNIIETITTLIFGIYLLLGTYYAYANARKRNIITHKNWVLRVYFVALSIASIRIVAGLGMALTGNKLKDMLGISFAIAFALHCIVVESWIRIFKVRL